MRRSAFPNPLRAASCPRRCSRYPAPRLITWVVYTRPAQDAFLAVPREKRAGVRSSSEPWALLAAEHVRERLKTSWGLAETGAAGPTGNSYGDAAGHTCVAIMGPNGGLARTIETGSPDREANMRAFALEALKLMDEQLV
jgi:nicotinamide-nucleotide amidase